MNYINNPSAGVCCAIGSSDSLELTETTTMIDQETGMEASFLSCGYVPGRMYRCERRWTIRKSFLVLKSFETESEARAAYDAAVKALSEVNHVIEI